MLLMSAIIELLPNGNKIHLKIFLFYFAEYLETNYRKFGEVEPYEAQTRKFLSVVGLAYSASKNEPSRTSRKGSFKNIQIFSCIGLCVHKRDHLRGNMNNHVLPKRSSLNINRSINQYRRLSTMYGNATDLRKVSIS